MLKLDQLYVAYGKSRIITGVSLHLAPGDRVCILGRNGVGKTTLLKAIMGLLKAERGMISLGEQVITSLRTYERSRLGIAYVPQGREIIPLLTVRENLLLGCMAHVPQEQNQLLEEVLTYFP